MTAAKLNSKRKLVGRRRNWERIFSWMSHTVVPEGRGRREEEEEWGRRGNRREAAEVLGEVGKEERQHC